MRRNIITPDITAQIIEMRERNMSYEAIGRRLNLPKTTVGYQCLKHYVEPSIPGKSQQMTTDHVKTYTRNGRNVRRFSPAEDKKLLNLEANGHSPTAIGKALARRHSSISNRLMILARRDARQEAEA